MSIICTSQYAYDLTFSIQEPLIENQKYRIMELFFCAGVSAASVAYLCVLWDAETVLISRCGKDFYGVEIRRVLREAGVDTVYLIEDESFSTPVSAIIASSFNRCRTILGCPGIQRKLEFHYLRQAGIPLLGDHELQVSLEVLSRYPNIDSTVDAGTFHEEISIPAQEVTHLVCSQGYARQFSSIEVSIQDEDNWRQTFDTLHALNAGHIVVTLGDQGLLYEDTQGIHYIEAFNVSVVDMIGVGDILHGAFTYCIHKSYPLQGALIIASATSMIFVQTPEGQIPIPTKAAVNGSLNEQCRHLILKQSYALCTDCSRVTCCLSSLNGYGQNMINYNYYPICRNACGCVYELGFRKAVSEMRK